MLVTAGAAVLVSVAVAGPANAQQVSPKPVNPPSSRPTGPVPGGFKTWADLITVQNKLNSAASRILAADSSGYAGIVAAPETRELRVYWKGQVPTKVRTLAQRAGVPVKFQAAGFTHRELVAEAQRIAADPRVATAAAKPDGSGLQVTVTADPLAAGQADILGTARMPVAATTGQRPEPLYSRQDDLAPFWGGSRYRSPVGGCSNGFAVSIPGQGNVFEISAGHCGDDGQPVTIPGQPSPTGSIVADFNARDTLVINYPAGVHGKIYSGGFDSQTSVDVGAAAPDFVGNWVCTGGASSGEHCDIQVTVVNEFVNVGYVIGPETRGVQLQGGCAAAPGDSGGPAYSRRADGKVDGRGTISAGITGTATCPGVRPDGSSTVWYAPLLRPAGDPQIGSLQFYGINILPF